MKRKRVYVAGAINAPSAGKFLNNIRKGIQLSKDVFLAGFAPWCPFLDYQYNLVMTDSEVKLIKTEDFYEYSLAWLEASEAVLVVPGWEDSVGTKKELSRAIELHIPVYYSMAELLVAEMKKP